MYSLKKKKNSAADRFAAIRNVRRLCLLRKYNVGKGNRFKLN